MPTRECCEMHVSHAFHMHEPGTDARIWTCDVWWAAHIGATHICNIVWCICSSNKGPSKVSTKSYNMYYTLATSLLLSHQDPYPPPVPYRIIEFNEIRNKSHRGNDCQRELFGAVGIKLE